MCSHAFKKILGLDRVPRTQSHNSDLESPTSSNSEIAAPTKITQDDFECICPLGRGKFGSVVLVSKRDTNKKYAMKVVKKASVLDGGRVKDLFSERSVLKRAKHPFIVKLDWTFQSEHKLFFVMEYLEGGDLATYLNNVPNKRFELDKARFYAGEVWEALNYLHENDVIYRDLKPENILLDIKGHACLSDFGLSKDFQCTDINPEQRCDSFVGSPFYVAPDVLRQQKYGKAVDWWSFGVLLYRMLTGVVPFGGKNMRQVFEAVLHRKPDLTPYTWLTEETKDLILKLLKKDEFSRLDGPGVHRHVFFNGLDWQKLKTKEIDPPAPAFVPPKNCNSLLFRTEEVQRSPPGALGSAQQRLFDGFTYIGSTNNLKPTTQLISIPSGTPPVGLLYIQQQI